MSLPTSGYGHYKLLMQKALDTGGFRLPCASQAEAYKIRQRCYKARTREREMSRRMYGPEEEEYDTTPYDSVELRIRGSDREGWKLVFIIGAGADILERKVEPLQEEDR